MAQILFEFFKHNSRQADAAKKEGRIKALVENVPLEESMHPNRANAQIS